MVNENYRQIVAVKCIRFLRIYAAYLSKVVYKFFHGRIIKSQVSLNIYLETNYKDLYLEKKKYTLLCHIGKIPVLWRLILATPYVFMINARGKRVEISLQHVRRPFRVPTGDG